MDQAAWNRSTRRAGDLGGARAGKCMRCIYIELIRIIGAGGGIGDAAGWCARDGGLSNRGDQLQRFACDAVPVHGRVDVDDHPDGLRAAARVVAVAIDAVAIPSIVLE